MAQAAFYFKNFPPTNRDEADEAEQERKLIIAKYDKLLDSFSNHVNDSREGIIMNDAENILVELVKESFANIIKTNSDVICVATAVAISYVNYYEKSLSITSPDLINNEKSFAIGREKALSDNIIEQAGIWAFKNLGPMHHKIICKIMGKEFQTQDDLKKQIKIAFQIYRNMNKYANKSV